MRIKEPVCNRPYFKRNRQATATNNYELVKREYSNYNGLSTLFTKSKLCTNFHKILPN